MVPFACMPSPIPRQVCWNLFARTVPPTSAFHEPGRVGSCIVGFGACSAFTHVTACTLAKSPCDSLHQSFRQSRCLNCCSDCYRVEANQFPGGLLPLWTTAFSRRTRLGDITGQSLPILRAS